MYININSLSDAIIDLLESRGVKRSPAESVAKALIWASARGIHSHGIRLLGHYLDAVQGGRISKKDNLSIKYTSPSVIHVNCKHAFGHYAGTQSMLELSTLAKKNGIAVASVINSNHCGALGYYSEIATSQGLIGVAMTQATARMPAPNSNKKTVGNNPISFGFPTENGQPLIYDASQSKTTFNAVNKAKAQGKTLDDDLVLDRNGLPTNDPNCADQLLPIGDYKGFGLALCVDLLTGGLGDQYLGDQVTQMFDGEFNKHRYLSQFYLVIDPSFFPIGNSFAKCVGEHSNRTRSNTTLEQSRKVTLPHDKEIEFLNSCPGKVHLSENELKLLKKFL